MKYIKLHELMIISMVLLLFLLGCSRNVEYVKQHAAARWGELGYTVVGYEGYQWSPFAGGDVWYVLKRVDSPGIIYTGYLVKWGDELHVYGPSIISGQQIKLKD